MSTQKTDFICIQEAAVGGQVFGVFQQTHDSPGEDRWLIARVPLSWRSARSSRTALPSPDGGGIEKPASLLKPFASKEEALKTFNRWLVLKTAMQAGSSVSA
jgi:hypothetical protein